MNSTQDGQCHFFDDPSAPPALLHLSKSTPAGSIALEPLQATPAIPSAATTALALAIDRLLRLIPSLLGANEIRPICVCWPLKCPWCTALRPLCDGRLHMIGDVTHPTLMNRILMAVVRRTQRGATSRLQPNRAPTDRSNTHAPVPPIISRHQRKPIRSASSAIAAVLLMRSVHSASANGVVAPSA